jgi:dTDP-4-amino-4,6-dideoxygalactose transaminase
MFYMLLPDLETRAALIDHLKSKDILSVFHYVPLHSAPVGQRFGYKHGDLPITEDTSDRIVRLPFYYDLTENDQADVVSEIKTFMHQYSRRRVAA